MAKSPLQSTLVIWRHGTTLGANARLKDFMPKETLSQEDVNKCHEIVGGPR